MDENQNQIGAPLRHSIPQQIRESTKKKRKPYVSKKVPGPKLTLRYDSYRLHKNTYAWVSAKLFPRNVRAGVESIPGLSSILSSTTMR